MAICLLKKAQIIPCDIEGKSLRGDILIEGDRIKGVGGDYPGKAADRVIELDGCTVLPGLIDLHIHLTFRRTIGPPREIIQEDDGLNVIRSVRNALTLLRQGVTTIRETGSRNNISLVLREAVARRIMPGPRILAAGSPLSITGSHSMTCIQCSGAEEFRKSARMLIGKGVDWIKTFATNDPTAVPTDGEYTHPEITLPELEAVVGTAHQFGKKVAIHAMGRKIIKRIAAYGVNTVEHGIYLDEEAAEAMNQHQVALVPTLSGYIETTLPRWNRGDLWRQRHLNLVKPHKESFQIALRQGVFIAFGTDSSGELLRELQLMIEYGMTISQVLQTATLNAARVLGLDHLIGSIEPGKTADLLVVQGNLMEDIGRVRKPVYIIKEGQIFKPESIRLPSGDENDDSEPWLHG